MKKAFVFFLLLILLTGCASQQEPVEILPPDETSEATVPASPSGLYQPDSDAERQSHGALRLYPLDTRGDVSFLPFGDNILLFSTTETGTDLILLSGETLTPERILSLDHTLTSRNATVQILDQGLSWFNGKTLETVIVDHSLQETDRFMVPADLCGMALLSRDAKTLYYCTPTAIRALDRESGISRMLRESAYPVQGISGILLEDSVLQVSITDVDGNWNTLYIDSGSGQLLRKYSGNPSVQAEDDFYFAQALSMDLPLFGDIHEDCQAFLPADPESDCRYLPGQKKVLTLSWSREGALQFDLYDLLTGLRTASLADVPITNPVELHSDSRGRIWILGETDAGTALFRWDPDRSTVEDDNLYTVPFHSREDPDYEAIEACSLYAGQLSEKYGIEILIYRDATDVQPWDYDLEYEYLAPVIWQELERLDNWLSHYPQGFLKILRQSFPDIRIGIVRSITGSPESGSLNSANGIQFWQDQTSYIILATGEESERVLYHELFHLIDTVVLTYSTAYDLWESLNSEDFAYDYDYLKNESRDGSRWLQPGQECFIDRYSMSYPKEDRARIMEYAMSPGNAGRFHSAVMQMKLRKLCIGIREAFDLKYSPEVFLWEQYLDLPLNHPET